MTSLQPSIIRNSTPKESAEYLKKFLASSQDQDATNQILGAIEQDSLPPSVFRAWIGISRTNDTLCSGLKQSISIAVRKIAIKQLEKRLKSARWRETWDGLGGTEGFIELFGDFSVDEVKAASRAIANSTRGADTDAKREVFTELFKALSPKFSSESTLRTHDERPLYYKRLSLGCTPAVVKNQLDDLMEGEQFGRSSPMNRSILRCHAKTLVEKAATITKGDNLDLKLWIFPLAKKYPGGQTEESGVSCSMKFALEFLKKLAKGEGPKISDKDFIYEIVRPLLKKALRRHVSWSLRQEILNTIIEYAERYPGVFEELTVEGRTVRGYKRIKPTISLIVQLWSRRPSLLQDQLSVFVQRGYGPSKPRIGDFQWAVNLVKHSCRYSIFKLYLKAALGLDPNIEAGWKESTGYLPAQLISKIEPDEAIHLLNLLRQERGDKGIVDNTNTLCPTRYTRLITDKYPKLGEYLGDPNMWEIQLKWKIPSSDKNQLRELANKYMKRDMELAKTLSDGYDRGCVAQFAQYFAIASRSLDILKEWFTWARRFDHDSKAAVKIYSQLPEELQKVLSGIPEIIGKDSTQQVIAKSVELANEILENLFDAVCFVAREPSFDKFDYRGHPFDIFGKVIKERAKRSISLQNANFTENDIYDLLWKGTLDIILKLEEKLLHKDYKYMGGVSSDGLLGYSGYVDYKSVVKLGTQLSPSTYIFFDKLAKARDEMWRNHREALRPAVTTLSDYFPRGLPVQNLISPFYFNIPDLEIKVPYIASRIEKAVFPSPDCLEPTPEDENQRAAIGEFVDSYCTALGLYLPSNLPNEEKKLRANRAWVHVTQTLQDRRLFRPEESVSYWKSIFQFVLGENWRPEATDQVVQQFDSARGMDTRDLASFWQPRFEAKSKQGWNSNTEVLEQPKGATWNLTPFNTIFRWRQLEVQTCIDLSTTQLEFVFGKHMEWRSNVSCKIKSEMTGQKFTLPAPMPPKIGIFSREAIAVATKDRRLRDIQALAALLFFDDQDKPSSRMLSTPFPSLDDVRYPAMRLGNEALSEARMGYNEEESKASLEEDAALKILTALVTSIPPKLLVRRIETMLGQDKERKKTISRLPWSFFRLARLLNRSDRPSLGSKLVVDLVLQYPDASSWARHVINARLFKRLPAAQAKECFKSFADGIIERLQKMQASSGEEEKKKKKNQDEDDEEEEEEDSYVKVSTVKLLAELARTSNAMSSDFSLSTLTSISENASHVDIRAAVYSALLSILNSQKTGDPERILATLETAIPMTSHLDERKPVSSADWEKATQTLTLPDVNIDFPHNAPVLKAMLNFYHDHEEFTHKRVFTKRVLIPTIENLKVETSKYLEILLKKMELGETVRKEILALPGVPKSNQLWGAIFPLGAAYFPITILDEYIDGMLAPGTHAKSISAAREKFGDEGSGRDYYNKEKVLWVHGEPRYFNQSSAGSCILALRDVVGKPGSEVTTEWLKKKFLKFLATIIDVSVANFEDVVKLLEPKKLDEKWNLESRDILESAIDYTEGLRTEEWEDDENRNPTVLPDTFPHRLWLLKFPLAEGEAREAECETFGNAIIGLVDRMSGSMYHEKLDQIKNYLKLVENKDRLRLIHQFGSIGEKLKTLTIAKYLRLDLAAYMISISHSRDDKVRGAINELMESWGRSKFEEIRRLKLGKQLGWDGPRAESAWGGYTAPGRNKNWRGGKSAW
ncbi:hypothetical protein TWF694_001349 [Orbilia ellipsospora]|uniref:Proteasome activator subunit 4 n=1 Tax=Orbilia ellipsospora TaxID=2528407 RepID=A0AAV9XSU2_9PEZI